MRQIEQSMWFMLSHSFISLITLIILMVVLGAVQLLLPPAESEPSRLFSFLIGNNTVISVFVGVFVGEGLRRLKASYLWTINKTYRYSLINAFLILVGIFSLFQSLIMSVHLNESKIYLALPMCVALFSAYMVLGETLIHKFTIPAIPILIVQLSRIDVNQTDIMLLIIIVSIALVHYLFKYGTKQSDPNSSSLNTLFMGHPAPSKHIVHLFNFWLAKMAAPLISNSKRDSSWTVSLPQTKLCIISIAYALLLILNTLMIDDKANFLIGTFLLMLMGGVLLAIFVETRQLIFQTRSIAHLFNPQNNQGIKKEVLRSVNKSILLNCTTLLLLVVSVTWLIGFQPNLIYLTFATLAVMAIGISYYPLLLCFSWQNVSLKLVISVTVLALTIFAACRWLKQHDISEWLAFESVLFSIAIYVIHLLSRLYYYRFPFEKLLVNK